MARVGHLSDEGEAFLAWLEGRGRSANTLAAYRRDLAAYERFLAARGSSLAQVDGADVEAYLASLTAAGRKPASVARALVALRALHRFCGTDPAGAVGGPAVPDAPPTVLDEDEVGRLLRAAEGDDAAARRDRAMFEVLYGCGLRISDLVGLSLADVGQDRLRIAGPHRREVPLARAAGDALAIWLAPGGRGSVAPARWRRPGDADAVFLNLQGGRLSRQGAWAIVRTHGTRAGLGERLSPHVLRHSFAAHLLARGAPPAAVQQLLGHPGPLHLDQLRRVLEAAHPRARPLDHAADLRSDAPGG